MGTQFLDLLIEAVVGYQAELSFNERHFQKIGDMAMEQFYREKSETFLTLAKILNRMKMTHEGNCLN